MRARHLALLALATGCTEKSTTEASTFASVTFDGDRTSFARDYEIALNVFGGSGDTEGEPAPYTPTFRVTIDALVAFDPSGETAGFDLVASVGDEEADLVPISLTEGGLGTASLEFIFRCDPVYGPCRRTVHVALERNDASTSRARIDVSLEASSSYSVRRRDADDYSEFAIIERVVRP